jgi:hypothetical protein
MQMTLIQSKASYEDVGMSYFNSWTRRLYVGYKILMKDLLLNVGLSSSLFHT